MTNLYEDTSDFSLTHTTFIIGNLKLLEFNIIRVFVANRFYNSSNNIVICYVVQFRLMTLRNVQKSATQIRERFTIFEQ